MAAKVHRSVIGVLLLSGAAVGWQHAAGVRHVRTLHRTSVVQMQQPEFKFSPLDAIVGTFEKLTDFRVARASHILLKSFTDDTVAKMEEWKVQLGDDPKAFAELARTSSQCPSRTKGTSAHSAGTYQCPCASGRFAVSQGGI
jgi:hypothetical protein